MHMEGTSMPIKNVHELLRDELRDIYHAERQLTQALPKMAKAARSQPLRSAFESHLEETRGHLDRLEQAFELLDARTRGKRCEAMEGLIEEASEMMEEIKFPEVLDVALISGAQKVEHYEIASYGSARALAQALGHAEVAKLLGQTLDEEKAADSKLNQIAIEDVNARAMKAA